MKMGFLVTNLFSHLQRSEIHPPLALKSFKAERLDLHNAIRTFLSIIDFTKLERLHLINCPDSSNVLTHLIGKSNKVNTVLQDFQYVDDGEDRGIVASFLRSFIGLRRVILHINVKGAESRDNLMKSLVLHGRTLEDLYLNFDRVEPGDTPVVQQFDHRIRNDESVLERSHFGEIANQFKQLRQVALALPFMQMKDVKNGEWGAFGAALNEMSRLPSLTTLYMLTVPHPTKDLFELERSADDTVWDWPRDDTAEETRLDAGMDKFATAIMGFLTHANTDPDYCPPVLGIGYTSLKLMESNRRINGVTMFKPVRYVPVWQMDVFGRTVIVAARAGVHMIKYMEPDSDILLV